MKRLLQKKQNKGFLLLGTMLFSSLFGSSPTVTYEDINGSTEECVFCPIARGFNEYNCAPSCRSTEFGVTFLYFQPNIDDTHYVLSSIDNVFNTSQYPHGKRYQNCPSYTPGFRLEAAIDVCPTISYLDLRFTYLKANFTHSVTGGFLYDTNGYPGFGAQDSPIYSGTARSRNWYTYYAGDLTYNRNFSTCYSDQFTFLTGLHIAYIKFREQTHSLGSFSSDTGTRPYNNTLNRCSQFLGIGPEFGLEYQYCLSCMPNFALNAKTRGALLCGYTKSDLSFITLRTGPVGVAVNNNEVWRVTPAVSADLSISYRLNCSCFRTIVELGYEFNWYSRCANKITGVDTAFAGDSFDNLNNFTLQGPYLSALFTF